MRAPAIVSLLFWTAGPAFADPALDAAITSLAQRWDVAQYTIENDDAQFRALTALESEAEALSRRHPTSAAPIAWRAIIMASQADAAHGLDGLPLATASRDLLETALTLHPEHNVQCAIYTTLGELYALAPGFPLSFGDRNRAESYLTRGVQCDPASAEANLYYGDFLADRGRFADASAALTQALAAPARPGRDIGDAHVRAEARDLLQSIRTRTTVRTP